MATTKELLEAGSLRKKLSESDSTFTKNPSTFLSASIPSWRVQEPETSSPQDDFESEQPIRRVSFPQQLEASSAFLRHNYDASLDECRKKAQNPHEPTIDGEDEDVSVEREDRVERHPTENEEQYFSREAFQEIVTAFTLREAERKADERKRPEGDSQPSSPSNKFLKRQARNAAKKDIRKAAKQREKEDSPILIARKTFEEVAIEVREVESGSQTTNANFAMSSPPSTAVSIESPPTSPTKGHDKPLVVGRTKPTPKMDPTTDSTAAAAFNSSIEENLKTNTAAAAPASTSQPTTKKEKASKQPKQPKAAPPSAPLSPALIDLRVGHILRAIAHPNADSLYVSTIAMGDPEGTDHTQKDEETGKIVRTVCSGLNGLVPLEEMQDRKIVVVANLKPVNMRSIKSAAMVLAASPKPEEGADPHAHDRVVELVMPPEGSDAGDKVFFEGWPYGEGKGPEKVLNPKKKQWEAIQPGFYTTEECVVGFDAARSEMGGEEKGKGDLVVEGKGKCTVKTLKGAVVR